MIISHERRFIFVHIYKVAGTSIKKALKPYADEMPHRFALDRLLHVFGLAAPVKDHVTALALKEQLPAEVFEGYFKFAFVRNPWDWLVSLYHYIRSHPLHPKHRTVKALSDFEAYLMWRNENDKVLQKDFVVDEEGNLLVDYLGRYENLETDFQEICRMIDVDCKLPCKNVSRHLDYSQYYTDDTIGLVSEQYREDIERFGYRFENR